MGPVCPKRAFSDAIVRSQTTCRTCPPPIAKPFTIAMTGFGRRRICICTSRTERRGVPSPSIYPPRPFTFMSPPEQKACVRSHSSSLCPSLRGVSAPVSSTTLICCASLTMEKACDSSAVVSGVKALRYLGRLMDIFAIPLYSSRTISLKSCIFFQFLMLCVINRFYS